MKSPEEPLDLISTTYSAAQRARTLLDPTGTSASMGLLPLEFLQ